MTFSLPSTSCLLKLPNITSLKCTCKEYNTITVFYFKYANLWRSCHLLGGCFNSLTMPGVWANMKSCSARQQIVFEVYFSLQIFNLLKPVDFYTLLMLISSSKRLKNISRYKQCEFVFYPISTRLINKIFSFLLWDCGMYHVREYIWTLSRTAKW